MDKQIRLVITLKSPDFDTELEGDWEECKPEVEQTYHGICEKIGTLNYLMIKVDGHSRYIAGDLIAYIDVEIDE